MTALVVGGDGLIGSAIGRKLGDVIQTTRRPGRAGRMLLDLLDPPKELPDVQTAYLCAGVNGFRECVGDRLTWRVNVDGVLAVAKCLHWRGAFLVYISTGAVEWSTEMYARQRAHVECALQAMCFPCIIRPERVHKDNVQEFATFAIRLAEDRKAGVHRWPIGD